MTPRCHQTASFIADQCLSCVLTWFCLPPCPTAARKKNHEVRFTSTFLHRDFNENTRHIELQAKSKVTRGGKKARLSDLLWMSWVGRCINNQWEKHDTLKGSEQWSRACSYQGNWGTFRFRHLGKAHCNVWQTGQHDLSYWTVWRRFSGEFCEGNL